MTGKEIGVRTGRGVAVAARVTARLVRVLVPLVVALLVLTGRVARRTLVLVVALLHTRLTARGPQTPPVTHTSAPAL